MKSSRFYSTGAILWDSHGKIFFVFAIWSISSVLTVLAIERAEKALHKELFETRQYNNQVRPSGDNGSVLTVTFMLALRQIVHVSEQQQTLYSNVYHSVKWVDKSLSWNESEFGVRRISLSSELLWRPDIVLSNSAKTEKEDEKSIIIVHSNGTCLWAPFTIEISYCPIDISWYPFDNQTCELLYTTWADDATDVNLTFAVDAVNLEMYRNSTEWTLTEARAEVTQQTFPYWPYPYNVLRYTFYLRRQSLYYEFNLIIPYTVIALLTVMVYFLPPETGDRIGLCITIVLSLAVYQMMVAEKVPPTSDAVPLVGMYFGSVMLMSALTLAGAIVVQHLHYRSDQVLKSSSNGTCVCICGSKRRHQGSCSSRAKTRTNASKSSDLNDIDDHNDFISNPLTYDVSRSPSDDVTMRRKALQWRYSAKVLDQVFFWMSSCYLVISAIAMLIYCGLMS